MFTAHKTQDGDDSFVSPTRSKSARLMYRMENPVQAKTTKMISTSHPFFTFQRCFNFSIMRVIRIKILNVQL